MLDKNINRQTAHEAAQNLISSASGTSGKAPGTSGKSPDLPDTTRLITLPALLLIAAIACWLVLWVGVLSPLCDNSGLLQLTAADQTREYENIRVEPVVAKRPSDGQIVGNLKIKNFESELVIGTRNDIGDELVLLSSVPMPGESGRAVIDACGTMLVDTLAKSGSQTELTLETYYGTYSYAIEKVFTFREGSADAMIGTDRQELLIYAELTDNTSDTPMYRGVLCTLISGVLVKWSGEVQ